MIIVWFYKFFKDKIYLVINYYFNIVFCYFGYESKLVNFYVFFMILFWVLLFCMYLYSIYKKNNYNKYLCKLKKIISGY